MFENQSVFFFYSTSWSSVIYMYIYSPPSDQKYCKLIQKLWFKLLKNKKRTSFIFFILVCAELHFNNEKLWISFNHKTKLRSIKMNSSSDVWFPSVAFIKTEILMVTVTVCIWVFVSSQCILFASASDLSGLFDFIQSSELTHPEIWDVNIWIWILNPEEMMGSKNRD